MKREHKTLAELHRREVDWLSVLLVAVWVLFTVWACSKAWQVMNHQPQSAPIETNVEEYR